jgi:DNA-binding NtrC family response regulator
MDKGRIFICDTQPEAQDHFGKMLASGGYASELFSNSTQLLKALAESQEALPDVILLDAALDGEGSLDVLRQIKARSTDLPVVMTSGIATIRGAVEAMKQGACEYLVKPIFGDELLKLVEQTIERRRLMQENRSLKAEIRRRFDPDQIVCRSAGFTKVLKLASKVATSEANVLVLGESGVGKELVASTIHYSSGRRDRRFLTINCAALTDTLLESQLFGHVKGSFTGAVGTQRGLVEEAHHGTLFLDEIGDISPNLQAKLLRVLQEREFLPVGSTRVRHADVRFIAATNRNLEEAVAQGTFREDLYYRLNVISLQVPPLRERSDDVTPLAEFFVKRYSTTVGQKISAAALEQMMAYAWPGNVRELENVVEMACILSEGNAIEPEHMPVKLAEGGVSEFVLPQEQMSLADVERLYIGQVYRQTRYHKMKTSQILGVSRKTLDRKLQQYEISRDDD